MVTEKGRGVRDPYCRLTGATALFANRAYIVRYWVCTHVEASAALNRAVDRSIEGPAVIKVVTAILRVLVVPGDFDRLIWGYRLSSMFGDH